MNKQDISTNTHVQIDRSIFASNGTHAMNYLVSLGIFMCQGHRMQRYRNHCKWHFCTTGMTGYKGQAILEPQLGLLHDNVLYCLQLFIKGYQ